MNSVCLVFIGTAKYADFFPEWYDGVSKNVFKDCKKTVLAFSDRITEPMFRREGVIGVTMKHMEWPYVTLLRFQVIQSALEHLEKSGVNVGDYFLFLDADLIAKTEITFSEVFGDESKDFVGVQHPGQLDNSSWNAFITNEESTACVTSICEDWKSKTYHQGCLWGGKIDSVKSMISECTKNIQIDLQNKIVADWHDESHMNNWFLKNYDNVSTLSSAFAFPDQEFWHQKLSSLGISPRMLHLDKPHSEFPRFPGGKKPTFANNDAVINNLKSQGIKFPITCISCGLVESRPVNFDVLSDWVYTEMTSGEKEMICEPCHYKTKEESK